MSAVGGDELELVEADGAVVEGVLGCGKGRGWARDGVAGGRVGVGEGRGVFGRGLGCGLRGGLPGHAAKEGLEPGKEDVEIERFGQVVVGAGVDAFKDVLGAGAGGEHKDGGITAGVAKGAGDREAVGAWEHAVEEDGGGGVGAGGGGGQKSGEGQVAVGEVLRAVALGAEVEEEALGEMGFVFDEGDEGRGGAFGHVLRMRGEGEVWQAVGAATLFGVGVGVGVGAGGGRDDEQGAHLLRSRRLCGADAGD